MAAIAARQAQERQERETRHWRAESMAAWLWQASSAANRHPYLVAKQIDNDGAHIVVRQSGDDLLVAMRTVATPLCNLQRIGPDGRKRFLPGGRLHGAFWSAGRFAGAPIIAIGEGFATMAAVHLATGLPVAAAMTAGNLEAVAVAVHGRFPAACFILCADMDTGPRGNIGLEKANAAAAAVPGALVARPPRPPAWPTEGEGWDFADTFNSPAGAELIRRALGMKDTPHG
jgi:putative DNA primase/helicase